MNTNRLILIGGSGLGPWAWARVAPLLRERGYDVHIPTLSATGDDTAPAGETTLKTWIDDVVGYMERHRLAGAALVSHSFAGYVGAGVLERLQSEVDAAMFIDAAVPEPGLSWFDAAGPQTRKFMESMAVDGAIPWFTEEQLDQFNPGHGITDADQAWMRAHLTAQPIGTYSEPAIHKAMALDAYRAVYVRCTRSTIPSAAIDEHTPGWDWRTLDAGHWPMITAPAALADTITEALE